MSAAGSVGSAGGAQGRGRFIVLDGIDGCGKSTQAKRLVAALGRRSERAPLHVREPGSTAVGEGLRALLLAPEHDLDPGTETLMLAAARRALLRERVAPALAEGRDVVCERFHPSTYAYQAEAGGLDGAAVLELLCGWAGEPEPDLVILLEVPPAQAARLAVMLPAPRRFEKNPYSAYLSYRTQRILGRMRYAEVPA